MGKEARPREVSAVRTFFLRSAWVGAVLGLGVCFISTGASAGVKKPGSRAVSDLAVKADLKWSAEPLTVEKVWTLDPGQINPHLQRWILNRTTEITGLSAFPLPESSRFGASAGGIVSNSGAYIRKPESGFQALSEFSCSKAPNSWFETYDGAKVAAEKAFDLWNDILEKNQIDLALRLRRISAPTEKRAMILGKEIFQYWLRKVDGEWRSRVSKTVRTAEWDSYLKQASEGDICEQKNRKTSPPKLIDLMELPAVVPSKVSQVLARAPVRIWDGYFTVRLNVKVGDRLLNGRFLIDTTARKSVMSPDWLENQGVILALLELPGVAPERVTGEIFSEKGKKGGHLARSILVDGVEMSGIHLPLKEFLMFDTDFFGPPSHVGSCCDGVLGVDFLRGYPLEFKTQIPREVLVWPRDRFRPAQPDSWVEIHEEGQGGVRSSCRLEGDAFDFERTSSSCTRAGFGSLREGPFTFDLPHGRLWVSSKALASKAKVNHSGLGLKYVAKDGDRALVAQSLLPGSPAQKLFRAGLRKGMSIVRMDGQDVIDLDQWDVDQRLAGYSGDWVVLEWRPRNGEVIVESLNVKGVGQADSQNSSPVLGR